ncbi:MAG: hemolysin family protein [Oscillospiraceae bacterium]|nr:hemolysin family protein [Oscillospiraceae bacterium]
MLHSIVILVVLTLISGVLSASEIALSSANRNRVRLLAESGDQKAARLLAVMDEPNSFFATTQLYITFIAFFSGAFAANAFTGPLLAWIGRVGLPLSSYAAEPVVFMVITALLTYFTLIFGELVPKRIALQHAIPFALRAIYLLRVLSILALPFVKFLSFSAKLVLRLIGIRGEKPEEDVTKEDIRLMVESGSEHGHIAESEQGMIENIFTFDTLTAAEICTHRIDVIALPIDADFETVIALLTDENYTRVPVYEESLDHIQGILHFKDVMHYMASHPDGADFDLKPLLREPYFVPSSKKIGELFQEMQKERTYMAVVIDEYGGTLGIVTMEDLVEEIVGGIQDEYDTDEVPDIVPLDENTFEIQGGTYLETVGDFFEVELPLGEYDTLSGFLVGQLGYIPTEDEKPEVVFEGLAFQIEHIQEKRVVTAKVTKCPVEEEREPASDDAE